MKKPKELEAWGRATARKRYDTGGGVEVESPAEDASATEESPEDKPLDRSAEVDEFISRVMQDQIKKMEGG